MFLIFFMLSGSAWANDSYFLPSDPQTSYPRNCTDIDYRKKISPPKTQGDTSFCFAYSSAELIHQRTGQEPSALDLAMGFYFADPELLESSKSPEIQQYLSQNPNTPAKLATDRYRAEDVTIDGPHPFWHKLEGGFELNTLLLANVRGLCAETKLSSQDGFFKYWQAIRKRVQMALAGRGRVSHEVDSIPKRFRSPVADRYNAWWLRRVNRICGHQPPSLPLVPVSYSIAINIPDFYKKFKAGEISPQAQEQVLATMDFALDNQRIAAIGFDLETILARPEGKNGDHSVAVIARRKQGHECQYLLRDSSGYNCNEYAEPLPKRCKNREVWLTENELKRSLYATIYLR